MKLNKVFQAILNSIGFNNTTETHINTEKYIETIGNVPVTSIVVGFEYKESDNSFAIACNFRVTQGITQDKNGTWEWKALNLDTQLETDIKCKQIGRAYWPKIVAA